MKPLLAASVAFVLFGCAATHPARITQPHEDAARLAEAMLEAEDVIDNSLIEIQVALGYRWHTAEAGNSVQYGSDTDKTALRVDCKDGRLLIIVPASTNAAEGSATSARFRNGEQRPGSISYRGDGPNSVIPVATDDPVVATLLTEGRIAIDTDHTSVRVPGAGGESLIRALIAQCRSPRL